MSKPKRKAEPHVWILEDKSGKPSTGLVERTKRDAEWNIHYRNLRGWRAVRYVRATR